MPFTKYIISIVLPLCLLLTSVEAQPNVDSLLQIWQDNSLEKEDRLTALYIATLQLIPLDPERALKLYDTFNMETLQSGISTHEVEKIELLRNLSFKYILISPDTAIRLSIQMLQLCEQQNNMKGQFRAYRRIGKAYEQKGKLDSALNYFDASMKLRIESRDEPMIATGYEDYAGLMISKGMYDSALTYYDSALQIYTRLNQEEEKSSVYNNKGVAYFYLGDVRNAIDNYYKSIEIDEKVGDHDRVAATKTNIGMLYSRMGELDKASESYNESLKYYESSRQSHRLNSLTVLGALASIESDIGNYKAAKRQYTDILTESRELGNESRITSGLMNRGLVNARMKEFQSAISDFQEALDISREIGAVQNLKITLANLGDTYLKMDSLDKAIEVSERVLELHKASESVVEAIVAYHTLYEANKKKENYETALKMYEHYNLLKDSLTYKESSRKIVEKEFESKYEKEKEKLQQQFEHEKKLTQLYFFFGGLLLATILFFLILQKMRKQKFQAEKKIRSP